MRHDTRRAARIFAALTIAALSQPGCHGSRSPSEPVAEFSGTFRAEGNPEVAGDTTVESPDNRANCP